jgi:hypothetical protein
VSRIIEATAAAGLPTNPILNKVQYATNVGRLRGKRVVAAASAVASRLEDARVALAPNPTDLDITAGADALMFGATKESLQTVRRVCVSRRRSVVGPLGVLAQLLAIKVGVDSATKAVTDLIERGATDGQLVALGNDVNADVASGSQPVVSMGTRVQGLAAVLSPPGAGFGFGGDKVTAPAAAGGGSLTGTRDNPPPPPKRP